MTSDGTMCDIDEAFERGMWPMFGEVVGEWCSELLNWYMDGIAGAFDMSMPCDIAPRSEPSGLSSCIRNSSSRPA